MMLRCLMMAGMLFGVGCTTVMKYTPQEMSAGAISRVKVDPATDPNPQTLAFDQTACANQARLQYPIVAVNEGGIMAGSMLSGAAGGAGSSAAAAIGTGQAGRAAAVSAVGGAAQGGQNGLQQIQNAYLIQIYEQAIHYGLCLEQHGHVIYGPSEADMARARSE